MHYTGASQATLDPLAAGRPELDIFAWAQQHPESDPHRINSGPPADQVALRDGTARWWTATAVAAVSHLRSLAAAAAPLTTRAGR